MKPTKIKVDKRAEPRFISDNLSMWTISTNFLTISSETKEPELIIDAIFIPNSVLFLISFLRSSPVDNLYKHEFDRKGY